MRRRCCREGEPLPAKDWSDEPREFCGVYSVNCVCDGLQLPCLDYGQPWECERMNGHEGPHEANIWHRQFKADKDHHKTITWGDDGVAVEVKHGDQAV